jgi:hypothetical protein
MRIKWGASHKMPSTELHVVNAHSVSRLVVMKVLWMQFGPDTAWMNIFIPISQLNKLMFKNCLPQGHIVNMW